MVIEVVAAPAVRDPAPAAVRLLELLADPTRRRLSLLLMRGETGNGPCRRHPPKVGLSPCPGQADGKEEEVVRILEPPGSQAIMAVAAHPDDIEGWCAGTLARAVDTRAVVRLLLVTSGDKGTADPNADPADVARLREREAILAAERLGIAEVAFLRYPDGDVENTRALRGDLVARIRRWRPAVLFTHDPVHPWPPYLGHRDHRAVGRAAFDAVYPLARDRLSFPEYAQAGLTPHAVRAVWLFASAIADQYVGIADGFE